MKTFAQKEHQSQKPGLSSIGRSNMTIHADRLAVGLPHAALPSFGHDLSRIPIHQAIQAKSAIDQPGNIYEEEAHRVSEQVLNISAPPLQRTCTCGGGCPRCQTVQSGRLHERVQTMQMVPGDFGQTVVPPIVHEVLRSPGHPLDPASRLFMEPRFARDFGDVRVHTDAKAAESAHAIGASAYTVGHEVVFGAGEFNPQNNEGRRLIAHELTHVVQQSNGSRTLQQEPKKGRVVRVERPRRSRPTPPGPGAYTYEELRKWYDTHPKKETKFVHLANGKRTQDEAYTYDALWVSGYVYAITNVHGDVGTEVWLNDDGDGKVMGIDREVPK